MGKKVLPVNYTVNHMAHQHPKSIGDGRNPIRQVAGFQRGQKGLPMWDCIVESTEL